MEEGRDAHSSCGERREGRREEREDDDAKDLHIMAERWRGERRRRQPQGSSSKQWG